MEGWTTQEVFRDLTEGGFGCYQISTNLPSWLKRYQGVSRQGANREWGVRQTMKKLLTWGAVILLTTAFLDPLLYAMLDKPIPWGRDILMAAAGVVCFYLLIKYRNEL
ncbi:MAG: hypothetical protein PHO83_15800 [Geobacteraceae bacterium]|nr:hypothetical protein [Geobacteraceae bacterium]